MEGHICDQKKHKFAEEAAFDLHSDCRFLKERVAVPDGHMARRPEGFYTWYVLSSSYSKNTEQNYQQEKGADCNFFFLVKRQKILKKKLAIL